MENYLSVGILSAVWSSSFQEAFLHLILRLQILSSRYFPGDYTQETEIASMFILSDSINIVSSHGIYGVDFSSQLKKLCKYDIVEIVQFPKHSFQGLLIISTYNIEKCESRIGNPSYFPIEKEIQE